MKLAGSFDTVSALHHLEQEGIAHVLCMPIHQPNSIGLPVYKPTKTYTVEQESMDTLLKTFNSEWLRRSLTT